MHPDSITRARDVHQQGKQYETHKAQQAFESHILYLFCRLTLRLTGSIDRANTGHAHTETHGARRAARQPAP